MIVVHDGRTSGSSAVHEAAASADLAVLQQGEDVNVLLRHAKVRTVVGGVVVALLALGVPSLTGTATAAPADEKLASDNPEDWTPRVLDKNVYAVVEIGGKVIVGGDFTTIQRPGSNTPQISRPYLFAFNASTGAIDDSFVPVLSGRVQSILPHPDGDKVWVGGAFTNVNGQNVSRLVLLNINTGQRVTSFSSPSINAVVNDVRRAGNRLYIGGQFTTVGGQNRARIASLDAATGALTTHLVTEIAGTNNGGTTSVRAMDVTPAGDKLVALGNFTEVDGQPRGQVAMWDVGGASASLSSWRTDLFGNVCSSSFNTYMRDIDLAPSGEFFVIVTTGAYRSGRLCDTATRWETYSTGSGQQPSWVDYSGGDTLTAVEVTGPVAYVGGHQRWMNNPFAGDKIGSGAVPREGLVALDTRNGMPFTWDPGRQRGVGVWDFMASATHLWSGSDTNYWAGEYRPRVAGFPFAGGVTLPPDRVGSLPGDVLLLGSPTSTTDDTARRVPFNGTSAGSVSTSTGPESWSQARGAFMVDNQLFTGWSNGTFTTRSFNGTTWGSAETVELYDYTNSSSTPGYLNNFKRDVANLTGIFYEPQDARIYYTMSGSSSLFWRYFTPESKIVGAERNTMSAAALSPANVRGMFLDGNQLYFSDQNGALRSIGFNRGALVGSASTVNTQLDWRARGMTVLTTAAPPTNQSPTASFTSSCTALSCTFDASGSSDPDGSIASYQWNFGDGTQGTGVNASRTYATSGTYTVTLTVTDNQGATNTTTRTVTVSAANQPPTASFTAECSGLTCGVDGSGSSDPDGSIASYAWNFGDGSSGSGQTAQRTYASAGTYTITLTVTDNQGATASTTRQVSVSQVSSAIAFRASSSSGGGASARPSVSVPGSVQSGDALLLAVSNGSERTAQAPAGWTLLDSRTDVDLRTDVFWKVAAGGDAGSSVQVVLVNSSGAAQSAQNTVTLAAYSGVGSPPVSAYQAAIEERNASVGDHQTPAVNVPSAGSWVVSYWADRTSDTTTTSATTAWAAPGGESSRVDEYSAASGGRVSSLLTDSGSGVGAGLRAGKTAEANGQTKKATMWSIVLRPS